MGDLIKMPLPKTTSGSLPDGASAEILFFTGVRYVRMESEQASRPPRVRRQRRRPVLKGADHQGIERIAQ